MPGRGFAGLAFAPPRKPLIAAVEGWALAGGCEIVLSCDLVIAAETAKFGIPEVKRGLAAAAGGLFRLPLRIPYHVAMELILTGDPVEARRAYELGLVNKLTPDRRRAGRGVRTRRQDRRQRAAGRRREQERRPARPRLVGRGGAAAQVEHRASGHDAVRTRRRAPGRSPRSGHRCGRVAEPSPSVA